MPEALVWREGRIYAWTGTATASALIAYATDSNLMPVRGWESRQTLGLTYYDLLTGRRADLAVGALYTTDATILKFFESETAVHLHLIHNITGQGSAGIFLWSGRIDSLPVIGMEDQAYKYQMAYHCNRWSAYGT